MADEDRTSSYLALRSNTLNNAISYRDSLQTETQLRELGEFLHRQLKDSIFEYWYSTPWDFNGVTTKPQEGQIACGYFVSTTLLHCGIKVERVKLAQQAASKIINTVCDKKSITSFSNGHYDQLLAYLKKQPNGLYIIGLDNHVAFVSIEENDIYAIHSAPPKVKRQQIDECPSIVQSKYHVIGALSTNIELIKKWIHQESIPTLL